MAIKSLAVAYDELRKKVDAYQSVEADDGSSYEAVREAAEDLVLAAELVLDLADHSPH
ncbi:hypothetical protein ACM0AZ_25020 [Mycobacteroides abscessus subsp. massiliense]|uniref:hypothetical protein n=1 Tax=Mycobacteroides abscessus TaxID=36809 RepID=UPI000925E274|nr:hypothetical protein [Mycobacteroides abscessus]SHU69770.1 Uncharacterised protein [Mycobacteroides abscessus subsp. abscessus]